MPEKKCLIFHHYKNIPMLKINLFFLCLVFYYSLFAQQENKVAALRYVKFYAADSLVPLAAPVKNQLSQLLISKKHPPLHLLFAAADKTAGNTVRWMAAKKQQDLYYVNLSAIVSKYIGETEKNLDRVFSTAEAQNYLLVFEEADALFGQHNTSNENDTNIGLSYFLQRSNAFKGTVIINCTGNNCLTKLEKKNFVLINAALQ
jgi:hypothetical protein